MNLRLIQASVFCLFVLLSLSVNAGMPVVQQGVENEAKNDLSIVFPDVCLTPLSPTGPMSIPYPNSPNVQAYKAVLTPAKGRKEQWIPITLGQQQTVSFRGMEYGASRKILLVSKFNEQTVKNFQNNLSINKKCNNRNKCIALTVNMKPPAGLPYGKYGLKLLKANGQMLAEFVFNVTSASKNAAKKPVKNKSNSGFTPKKEQLQQKLQPTIKSPQ